MWLSTWKSSFMTLTLWPFNRSLLIFSSLNFNWPSPTRLARCIQSVYSFRFWSVFVSEETWYFRLRNRFLIQTSFRAKSSSSWQGLFRVGLICVQKIKVFVNQLSQFRFSLVHHSCIVWSPDTVRFLLNFFVEPLPLGESECARFLPHEFEDAGSWLQAFCVRVVFGERNLLLLDEDALTSLILGAYHIFLSLRMCLIPSAHQLL